MTFDLSPPPQRLRTTGGRTSSRRIKKSIGATGRPEADSYRLKIGRDGIVLTSPTPQGFFYGRQTLLQLRSQFGAKLPCLDIVDWPDYPVRGFYHDLSRGKVPTLKTLLQLAERCARHKLNHLELYIEHTYAYQGHREVWEGADPLTADEIRAFDARCAELHIDLVPSFSTFGHFYTWIHRKFPELNELERDVSGDPFCWWDRMAHYTLDCRNPRSIALIRELIAEVRPLFRSKHFNICADETFDLGRGRNRALAEKVGKGRLYVDFLKQIMAAVREAGAVPLFWGDIIGHHPELIAEIPREAVVLDWDYSAELRQTQAPLMEKSGRPFYVCPSVIGHNNWLPDYRLAHRNITRFAKFGRKHGASGLLNTDWGDYGHIHAFGPTLPGLALGAAAAWNTGSPALREKTFQATTSRMILGDPSGTLLGLLGEAVSAKRGRWPVLCWIRQPRSKNRPEEHFDAATGFPKELFDHSPRLHRAALEKIGEITRQVEKRLARCRPSDPLLIEEIRVGLLGLALTEELTLFYLHRAGKTRLPVDPKGVARRLRELDRRLGAVWKKRNKASEYFRIREVLQGMVGDLEKV